MISREGAPGRELSTIPAMTGDLVSQGPTGVADPIDRVRAAYAEIEASDRPEVWITLRPRDDSLAEAELVQARLEDGRCSSQGSRSA